MRVVHLGKYYPPATGGIETHTQTLCRGLAALGTDVRVVVVNHADKGGNDVTFNSSAVTPNATDSDGAIRIHRVGRVANVAKLDITPQLPGLLRKLLRDPPDVWHLHTPNVTMLMALAAMPAIRPLIITHHSDIVRQKVLKYGVRPLEMIVYRRAARLLSTSLPYIDGSPLLMKYRAKTEALALGLDLAPFRHPSDVALDYAAKLRAMHGPVLWLGVGRLIYYKALEVALVALKQLPGKLLVIGTGPMLENWKALAASLGVADRVVWLGRSTADELIGAYHAATAFWFPSNARAEGFGLVQVEAMASGCPVINTTISHSGVPWVSPDDVSGLTIPLNDPAALASTSRRLLEDPELRAKLSAGAIARAEAEFDHRVMAIRCLGHYEAVLAGASQ